MEERTLEYRHFLFCLFSRRVIKASVESGADVKSFLALSRFRTLSRCLIGQRVGDILRIQMLGNVLTLSI